MGHIFLLISMPDKFLFDIKYVEFYNVNYRILSYSLKTIGFCSGTQATNFRSL